MHIKNDEALDMIYSSYVILLLCRFEWTSKHLKNDILPLYESKETYVFFFCKQNLMFVYIFF